ncbi:MAG: hypothetical protein ACQERC_04905 [Bacteroidota bacterium]
MKLKQLIPLVLFAALIVAACKKYEDGPAISLRSKKKRVEGIWKIDKKFDAQEEQLQLTSDDLKVRWEFKDTIYREVFSGTTQISGTWEFTESKERILVNYEDTTGKYTRDYRILRLTNSDLWLKFEDSTEIYFSSTE